MMKTVPNGWKIEKLGNLGKVLTGKTPSKKVPEFWDSQDIPFYKPDDFSKSSITDLYDGKDYISNSAFIKAVKAPNNSVLTTCIGIIGKVAITKKECSFNQQINAVIPDERINHKFLAYSIIRLKEILQQQANAAVVPMINKSEFSKTPIIYPPLPQQEKIVTVLDTASQLIEKQKALIEKYDLFLKSKFIEMFGDPVLNPMGWEIIKLKDMCCNSGEYGSGASAVEYDENKPRYIRITDVQSNGVLKEEKVSPSLIEEKYFLNDGDLLFARSGATVGKTYLHFENGKAYQFAGYMIRFIPNRELVEPTFLYQYTKTNQYQSWIESKQKVVAQPNINAKQYADLNIFLPPFTLQNQYTKIVEQVQQLKQKEGQKLEKLQTLYDALMQQAFNGEIV